MHMFRVLRFVKWRMRSISPTSGNGGGACAAKGSCNGAGTYPCNSPDDCTEEGELCCARETTADAGTAYSECVQGTCGEPNIPLCEETNQCPVLTDTCITPTPGLPNGYKICRAP